MRTATADETRIMPNASNNGRPEFWDEKIGDLDLDSDSQVGHSGIAELLEWVHHHYAIVILTFVEVFAPQFFDRGRTSGGQDQSIPE